MLHGQELRVQVINAEASVRTRPRGVWQGPYRYDSWVIDWCGNDGHLVDVGTGPSATGAVPRQARSWHLYAPQVPYRHCDTRPPPTEQALWCIFDIRATHWPLAQRAFSVILDPDERLAPHLYAMRALTERGGAGDDTALHGRALAVLGEVITASQGQGEGTPGSPWRIGGVERDRSALTARLEREVLRGLARLPGLDSLAARLGMSVSSLAHRCKAETGQAVMQRARWIRIREAQRLLRLPQASVKQTAARLGFSSAYHFSAVFRALTGLSPRAYMERWSRVAAE